MSANFSSTMETKNDLVTLTSAAITANINKNPSRNFKLVKTKSNDDEILHKFSFYIIFSIFRFSSFVCLLCFHFSLSLSCSPTRLDIIIPHFSVFFQLEIELCEF